MPLDPVIFVLLVFFKPIFVGACNFCLKATQRAFDHLP